MHSLRVLTNTPLGVGTPGLYRDGTLQADTWLLVIPEDAVLARPAVTFTTWYTCSFFLGKISYSLFKVQFTYRPGYTSMQGASAMQNLLKRVDMYSAVKVLAFVTLCFVRVT